MVIRPSVLCATDFSAASRGALRYAAAIAEHFYARLTVVTVNDEFLTDAADAALGETWFEMKTQQALEQLVDDAFPGRTPQFAELQLVIKVGRPAPEILRVAHETSADAIVMSTHGASGISKLMFGSTTERVLRETDLPVIVTPAIDPGPETLEDWRASVKSVVAPVDLSEYSPRQLTIARGLAEALGTQIVVTHIVKPSAGAVGGRIAEDADDKRRANAYQRLEELVADVPPRLNPVIAIGTGDPAAEIARIAKEHVAGAIVMALHTSPDTGRRMGTVTYRLLCQAPTLVIACPPHLAMPGGLALTRSRSAENQAKRPESSASQHSHA